MKIKWKDGSRFKASPGSAYNFFEQERNASNGDIDWSKAERSASLKGCAIHNDLEWNDTKCGKLFRIDQMKHMVRKLEYIPAKMKTPVRVYESMKLEVTKLDPSDPGNTAHKTTSVYRKTEDILADPVARAGLLQQAVRDAIAYRRRYAALSELAVVIDAIDEAVSNFS